MILKVRENGDRKIRKKRSLVGEKNALRWVYNMTSVVSFGHPGIVH